MTAWRRGWKITNISQNPQTPGTQSNEKEMGSVV